MAAKLFSDKLGVWLHGDSPKTIESLNEAFAEKSFAIIFLLLMFLPALPLPTGGISHIFEVIVMLVSLELIVGRETVWLPKKWRTLRLKGITSPKGSRAILKYVKIAERFARPRMSGMFAGKSFGRLFGLLVLIFTFFAFIPVPFLGLDTLPSIGVVLMSLAFIFEDAVLFLLGITAGLAGIAVDFTIGAGAFRAINHFL